MACQLLEILVCQKLQIKIKCGLPISYRRQKLVPSNIILHPLFEKEVPRSEKEWNHIWNSSLEEMLQ